MADESSQFPASYRYFGSQFQLWRQNAQVRRETIAEAANYSVDTVKSVEQGRRRVPPRLAEIADEMFGARGMLLAGLSHLKREPFPARSQDYFRYDSEAIALNWFELALIPGPLQTEAYALALMSDFSPPLDDETIQDRVAARMERKALLTRKPLVGCSFIIYEAALRCPVGGREAFREQMLHLLEVSKQRNISVQVLLRAGDSFGSWRSHGPVGDSGPRALRAGGRTVDEPAGIGSGRGQFPHPALWHDPHAGTQCR